MTSACIIFDTQYGNTEKVARSLEKGLKEAGFQAACASVNEVVVNSLSGYDLICVGGPTQYRTASKTMQDFLESLSSANLTGKQAFAFDTRRGFFMAGSAARYIEEVLRKRGMRIVGERQSAIITAPEREQEVREFENKDERKEWRHENERLREGEEERFEQIGAQIGRAILGISSMEHS